MADGGRSAETMKKHSLYNKDALWSEIWSPGGLELPETVADEMQLPAGSIVLDAGAGSGEISCFLSREYGWRMLAMDGGANGIQKKANERGLEKSVIALKGNLCQMDLASDSMDGVICLGTFEMLQDRRPQALAEMKRVVRNGGIIGIGEPMLRREMRDEEAYRLYGEQDECDFRKCFRTLDWNKALAEEAGLEILHGFLHPESIKLWDDYYNPLFDSAGNLKYPNRKAETDIWKKEEGKYHALGILILRKKEQ